MKSILLVLIGLLLIACGPSKEELDVVKHDKEQIATQLTECKAQLNERTRVITGAYHGTETLIRKSVGCKGDTPIGEVRARTVYLTEQSDGVYFGLGTSCKGRRFNDEVVASCSLGSGSFSSNDHYKLSFDDGVLHGEITSTTMIPTHICVLVYAFVATYKK